MCGADATLGHRMRDGDLPAFSATVRKKVVIVGAGIAGLSAARALALAGEQDFVVLDLELEAGGNSRSGKNERGRFPLGAHYLPIPDPSDQQLVEFLKEAGVCTGVGDDGLPTYNEEHVCGHPHERLFHLGVWRAGLVPKVGLSIDELEQFERFDSYLQKCADAKDEQGRYAFAVPVEGMSFAEELKEFRDLDTLSFGAWMESQGYTCDAIRWYMDYCCLDDYGAPAGTVSAYAGLHYFAARRGRAGNAEAGAVLTWPEGNAFLANALAKHAVDHFESGRLAHTLTLTETAVELDVFDAAKSITMRYLAEQVILCVPQFVAARILGDLNAQRTKDLHYAPWVVVNLTLDAYPEERGGEPMAWDNVRYGSGTLGYVNSAHQQLDRVPGPIITHYRALTASTPEEARRIAYERTKEDWVNDAIEELRVVHPDIDERVIQANVALWGHGMVVPVPGLITSDTRRALALPIADRIHFAHSDLSGISIFEEAFHHGLRAAKEVLQQMPPKT